MSSRVGALILIFASSASAMAGGYYHQKARHLGLPSFSSLDTDGNGWIEIAEFSQQETSTLGRHTAFEHLDANGDGLISEDELASHTPPRKHPPSFPALDTDGNGVVDFVEFSQQRMVHRELDTLFRRIDTDSDGFISERELASYQWVH